MSYTAPVKDMRFVIEHVVGSAAVAELPGYGDATPDIIEAILDQAGKFASDVLAPLNVIGDQQGAKWTEDGVVTPEGWKDAYAQFTEAGWNSLAFDPEYGGQGMPGLLSAAVQEMWHSSNMSFGLCPLLTQGAVHAINSHASDQLKQTYLEKMISGEWTGTMNLTEPQAGSDLAAVRATAEPAGDHYLIKGQKIFITYGDHDLAENTIHLVLARTPDAPPGVKGISLFVVPKFLLDSDGNVTDQRNDAFCVSIEHKLGIHASPTCVMAFGDNTGATGYLVGEENRGLMYMFTMMNEARLAVGIEGYAMGEIAYQRAAAFAQDRKQGAVMLGGEGGSPGIVNHPDVRRMLMTMRSQVEAARVIAYDCAAAFDFGSRHPDDDTRERFDRRGALLTPIVKGWSTELGVDICSLGVQVHGGMGFVEETGAAQYLRDVRITPIYEGTTGIQANDLLGRKTQYDGGRGIEELLVDMKSTLAALTASDELSARAAASLKQGIEMIESTVAHLLAQETPEMAAAAAYDYLMLMGYCCGSWAMARSVLALGAVDDPAFSELKRSTSRFYFDCIAPRALGHYHAIQNVSADHFAVDAAAL
jgi:acyl-CoA dehydrogenase